MSQVSGGRRPWARSIAYGIGLGGFFFLTYGLSNLLTSRRLYVPSIAFGWERRIPFLAWTIVPYWTSDALYVASVLVCKTISELHVQVKRLVVAQIICVAGFLLFPLRCEFIRPATHGVFGWLFQVLLGFDKPYNQAPSLHVALAVVLWSRFAEHLEGWRRREMAAWLGLIVLSTLTTYQHQFIDVPTGLLAGCLAIALVPEHSLDRSGQRFRLAIFYLSGATFAAALACKAGGSGRLLLWPAAAMLVVAAIYGTDRAGAFRVGIVRAIAAPYIMVAWINSRWWTRGKCAQHEIADGVWLGRAPRRWSGGSIVNLAAELDVSVRGIPCVDIPMLDLVTPEPRQLADAVAAIESFASRRPTLVCCALGYERSASVMACWLVASGRARSLEEATGIIRERRPGVVLAEF